MIRVFAEGLLAGSLALTLLLAGCSQPGPAPAATPIGQRPGMVAATPSHVEVATVQRGTLSNTFSFSGNVQARQKVNIIPKVAGRVTKVAVDLGSVVKAGDALLELEQEVLAAQVAQAQAGLDAAQAKLDGLEAGPRAEQVAQAEAGLEVAQARLNGLKAGPRVEQVAQAEANLRSAQARLDQLKAGPTKEQLETAEAQVRLAKNQLYLAQTQADAALGSRLPNTFTKEQKEAQSGVIWEQIQIAEANLAQLKAGPNPEQLAQAEGAVEAARQQLALAKQPITENDLQAARAAATQAQAVVDFAKQPATKYDIQAVRATVAQAKAAVELARLQLAEATVRAPFSGVVSQRLVSEGSMVGPTSPVLTLISADTEVVISVDERALAILESGQPATITTSAYPGEEFPATVATIAPTVDVRSRTAEVRLSPQEAASKLRDGMFAQVRLPASTAREGTLMVPRNAVIQEDSVTVVYLVADGRAKRQVVTTGATDGDRIGIVKGLVEGQKVAVSGLSDLADGAEVTVQ